MAIKRKSSQMPFGLDIRRYVAPSPGAKASGRKEDVALGAPSNNSEVSSFDAEYVRRLKMRDAETEAHFYQYFRPRLLMKLSSHPLPEADKLEIIQETLRGVLKSIQENAVVEPETLGAYVSGVCSQVRSGYWSRQNARPEFIEIPAPELNFETPLECKQEARVKATLKDLSRRDRNLLRAKLFGGVSPQEMVVTFGASSPGHLRLLLARAGKRFAKVS